MFRIDLYGNTDPHPNPGAMNSANINTFTLVLIPNLKKHFVLYV
jgi:hypothetical protein